MKDIKDMVPGEMELGAENIGTKGLTISDIAKALGVSKTTVSRAISGKGRVGSETRLRVQEYIKEHNYKPNAFAQGLAMSKTYNIGLTLPGDYDAVDIPFFQDSMLGVSEMAASRGYDLMISLMIKNDISQLEHLVDNKKVDGVILSRTYINDAAANFLKSREVPFVTMGSLEDDSIIQVDIDNEGACRELTSILLMRGIKKIALIGGNSTHMVTHKRLNGFIDAFVENSIPINRNLIFLDTESPLMIEKVTEDLESMDVDCIFCMDDKICRCVLNKLSKDHISIPADMKVASFYNSKLLDNNIVPITSIQFDARKLGVMSCSILLDMLAGKKAVSRTILDYSVSMKESTKL